MYIYLFFIIIGALVLSSTIIMTIWFKTNRILNFYLIFTSVTLCIYLIFHGLNNCELIKGWQDLWNFNYYQLVLILVPSVYLFFDKLIHNIKYPETNDLYYFIIPVLFFYSLSSFEVLHFLPEQLLVFGVFVAYVFFYCWKSFHLLKRSIWNRDSYYVNLSPVVINWANFIFKMMLLVLAHFFLYFGAHFFMINPAIHFVLESSLLVIFLIGYFKVVFSPILLYGSSEIKRLSNANDVSKLHLDKVWVLENNRNIQSARDVQVNNRIHDKINSYVAQIENIALVNYSFRSGNYSVNELSMELGVPKYYIEFIFKYHCKVSFNEYKKIVRIYDAVKLINEGYLSSNTLDTLSRHVGFASYNPFLINFKEIIGVSPFDYYKNRTIVRNKILP